MCNFTYFNYLSSKKKLDCQKNKVASCWAGMCICATIFYKIRHLGQKDIIKQYQFFLFVFTVPTCK